MTSRVQEWNLYKVRESLLRAGMEYDCVKYGILRHVVNISK